jgi:haloalkane dehalogenase
MPIRATPFAARKLLDVKARRMAYIDEGDAIVFQHGNPTSSYLWRDEGSHLVREGRPNEIGTVLAAFVRQLRGTGA